MTKDTPRVDAIALRLTGKTGLWCDDESLAQYNDLVDEARTLERDLTACREALRELHDDIQGRIDDGDKFNPGTLHALSAARAILQTGDGEGT